jgi:N-acetylgalactosamine kinase
MRNRYMHKVCFDVAGVPTIVRALDTFNRLGALQNVVVVGEMAGQVVETVGERFSNVVFAFQPRALGTGDAARCGLQALAPVGDDARVLVVAGDKILDSGALAGLLEACDARQDDLQILVTPAERGGGSAGRILLDAEGRPAGIAELADIRLRACRAALWEHLAGAEARVSRERLAEIVVQQGFPATALRVLCGPDWSADGGTDDDGQGWETRALREALANLPRAFDLGPGRAPVPPELALESPLRNESVYLVRKGALAFGLQQMTADNAQGEEYLTDAIGAILSARSDHGLRFRAGYVTTRSAHDVMSYNNPEELLRINDYFEGKTQQSLSDQKRRLGTAAFREIGQWLELFPDQPEPPPATCATLAEHYGADPALLAERHRACRETLLRFREEFGTDRHAIIVRSPGRINVMGRHIDYQGGRCNLMAVNQEVIMVVSPRDDDRIEMRNVQNELFPDASVSIGRLVSQLNWDDWLSCISCVELERHLRASAGNWSIYIEAAVLRMQMAFRQQMLHGMDLVAHGNIPVAAGMSSSSALVVSTAEAAAALHGWEVTPSQFVNFCGEGEWFVGTRGGSADHAAMKYGAKGTINHVKFHDFELLEQIPFPDDYRMVVCNSYMQAQKAAGAKRAFNSRVASYVLGVEWTRLRFPQYAPLIHYVRDIDSDTLRVGPDKIYEVLLAMPESMTAEQVRRTFSSHQSWERLSPHFASADATDVYPVRGVMWFGIAECARARQAAHCLKQRDLRALGELMTISHDGERCFHVDDQLRATPFAADISDGRLRTLIADLVRGDPSRAEQAQLHRQPGAYRCSIREIDALVDIAGRTPGVLGAQIAGAGLGGCAMVLVETAAVDQLIRRLDQLFYQPLSLPSGIRVCTPTAGSSLVRIPG